MEVRKDCDLQAVFSDGMSISTPKTKEIDLLMSGTDAHSSEVSIAI
jgi:hypothetical protein